MLGYCSTGSRTIASTPASAMKIAMTHAKIGRSMKKRDSMLAYFDPSRDAAGAEGARVVAARRMRTAFAF